MLKAECETCGKIYSVIKQRITTTRFCSYSCKGKSNKGFKHSDETKKRLSITKINTKNPNWKDDEVGYAALHDYIKRRLEKPPVCDCCKKNKPYDLANKGIYNRELKNWEWLCRKCHMDKDGRNKNLANISSKKGEANGRAKLKEKDVSEIRKMLKNGYKVKYLMIEYNVAQTTILNIKNNISWNK